MEEELKEIKEKITSFVNKYDITDLYVYIDDNINVNNINGQKPIRKDVIIEVRI